MGHPQNNRLSGRRLVGRRRPEFDRLDARMVLSGTTSGALLDSFESGGEVGTSLGSSLSIVSTTPASSSTLAGSPTTLAISFDRGVDDFSLGNADFVIERRGQDGSTTPIGPGEAQISEGLDPSDPTGSRILLTLSKALVPGSYDLVLSGQSMIAGVDGSSMADPGSDQILTRFTVASPTTGADSAVDLHTLGATVTVRTGRLDLASEPGQVDFYRFTVGPDHQWRVGIEVSSQGEGGSLASAVAIFDSRGRRVQVSNTGLPASPGDPYLFAGLAPGTYTVGVSSKKNLPDLLGHYDPAQSVVDAANLGGAYQIRMVADPADQPVQVLGLRVDHDDPWSISPTGLTVQFSNAIDPKTIPDAQQPALVLVDQGGHRWSLTPTGYDASTAQLSLAFNQALPSGSYAVELAGPGSLLDLAGAAPQAKGFDNGTLGSVQIKQSIRPSGDLGPIFPAAATSGLTISAKVQPGLASIESFTVVQPGVYAFDGLRPGGPIRFTILDSAGNILASGPSSNRGGSTSLVLPAGGYSLAITTSGLDSAGVRVRVREVGRLSASLLEGGVAQGPALNLRLVTPQVGFGTPSTSTASPINPGFSSVQNPISPPSTPSPGSSSTTLSEKAGPGSDSAGKSLNGSGASVAVGLSTPSGPSVAGLYYGGGPVGRPSPQNSQISVVGPSGSSGLAAIASNTSGLPLGLASVPVVTEGPALDRDEPPLDRKPRKLAPPVPREGATLDEGLLARSTGSRLADDQTLVQNDWLGLLVSRSMNWLDGRQVEDFQEVPEALTTEAIVAQSLEDAPGEGSRLETASMTSPIGLGVLVATVAYRYRGKFLARFRSGLKSSPRATLQPVLAGPHHRPRSRVR